MRGNWTFLPVPSAAFLPITALLGTKSERLVATSENATKAYNGMLAAPSADFIGRTK